MRNQSTRVRMLWLSRPCGAVLVAACVLGTPLASAAEPPQGAELKTADDLRQFEERLQEVVRRVAPAVVILRSKKKDTPGSSGVVFDESGLILTHGHHDDPKPSDEFEVRFPDGRVVRAKRISIYDAAGCDWSLLKIQEPGKWPVAPLHRGKPPEVNQWCFHLGYPGVVSIREIRTPVLRLGRVVGIGHYRIYAHCLITTGDSGGPLFDFQGHVIGVAKGNVGLSPEHASHWVGVPALVDDEVLLGVRPVDEKRQLGLMGKNRRRFNTNRGLPTEPFEELLGPARRATVQVLLDGRRAALGVVVDSDGIILTKRAEILTGRGEPAGEISCRLQDGEELPAQVIADLHEHDLALVQVDRRGLPTAPWSEADKVEQGWVIAAPGLQKEPPAVGVLSTDHVFEVKPYEGYAGIEVEPAEGGVRVRDDDEFPLKVYSYAWPQIRGGDLITHIDGKPTPDRDSYVKATVGEQSIAGDQIRMTFLRDGVPRKVVFPTNSGHPRDTGMEGSLSRRRTGFPAVIGHDAVLRREQCGGPLVDGRGKVIGVNIARCGRQQTLAIPHTVVRKLVDQMLAAAERK